MTLDQLLFVASRIHDPTRTSEEVAARAARLIIACEAVVRIQDSPEEFIQAVSLDEFYKDLLNGADK